MGLGDGRPRRIVKSFMIKLISVLANRYCLGYLGRKCPGELSVSSFFSRWDLSGGELPGGTVRMRIFSGGGGTVRKELSDR